MKRWCKHYRGMHQKDCCEAGVVFDEFKTNGIKFDEMPCFGPEHEDNCPLAEYPTDEEMAAAKAEMDQQWANIGKARTAIVEHLGGPWKKGKSGSDRIGNLIEFVPGLGDVGQALGGTIECPVCGGKLHFSRSGYNGHIHAACSNEDCVRWME